MIPELANGPVAPQLPLWKKILYSLIPLIVILAVLEGTCRIVEIWIPPWAVDYGWGFTPESRLFAVDEDEPGTMRTVPAKRVVFQEQSFAMPKPDRHFRVFPVGGSSVNYAEGSFIALGLRLSALALGRYNFQFINAGGCGYGSHRLLPIVSEVLNYQPDMIIYYEAHNEFQEFEQLQFAQLRALPLQKALYKSALCRFMRDRIASLQLIRLRHKRNQQISRLTPKENGSWDEKNFTQEQIDERMREFEKNLTTVIELCQARGVPLIISTVPSNLWEPRLADKDALRQLRELYDAGDYEAGMRYAHKALRKYARSQSCDVENEIIRRLARDYRVPLADVEAKVIAAEPHHVPGETLFNDWCHLNQAGNEHMMDAFQEQIIEYVRNRDSMR